jgi:hypothetical protein
MEIVTLEDGKEYKEYSITELEKERLNAEINRQLKTGRISITNHEVFPLSSDARTGKRMAR